MAPSLPRSQTSWLHRRGCWAFLVCIMGLTCFILILHPASAESAERHPPVYLEDVKTLTLRHGHYTTGRRLKAVPQLKCVKGCEFQPDVVQCLNVGSDGRDVQWRCEADLPGHLRFGETYVMCEGYESPDDRRVLEGSCGLEYTLKRTGTSGGGFSFFPWRGEGGGQSHGRKRSSRWEWADIGLALIVGYISWATVRSCCGGRGQRWSSWANQAPPAQGAGSRFAQYEPTNGRSTSGNRPPPSCSPSAPPPPPPPHPPRYPGWGFGGLGFSSSPFLGGSSSSSWAANLASLGAGYWLGSRGTVAHVPNHGDRSRYWSGVSASEASGLNGRDRAESPTRTATAYASTKRR